MRSYRYMHVARGGAYTDAVLSDTIDAPRIHEMHRRRSGPA